MNLLDIPATKSTPRISFDVASHRLLMSGESYPENSFFFYAPVFLWLKEHLTTSPALTIDINISYMNSSSTKCMLDALDLLEGAFENGTKIEIIWRYDKENPRAFDLAEEFSEEVTFPFNIVAANE